MTTLTPWFGRAFPGGYPVELFPSLLARLRGTIVRVRAEVEGLPPERLTLVHDGDWSIQKHVGHLSDLEDLWLARLDDFERGEPVLTAADLTNQRTYQADHDVRSMAELLEGFARIRAELLRRVEGWDARLGERVARHPRLDQPMRAIDLLLFVAEHDDQHLARIHELRR